MTSPLNHAEMVALIRDAVPRGDPGPAIAATWADLGAGGGNFTRALAELLPPSSMVYAVDLDVRREQDEHAPNGVLIRWRRGDFTHPLDLPALDGILIANALHFIRPQNQPTVLRLMRRMLRPGGRLVLVEYEPDRPLSFVPYPISFARFQGLARDSGLDAPVRTGARRSPRTGVTMFAAVAAPSGDVASS